MPRASAVAWAACLHAAAWGGCLAQECAHPWKRINGRCFLLSSTQHTFESCQRDVCGPRGGVLACVRQEDNMWLAWNFGLGRTNDILAVWIGYSKAGTSKHWSWTNGCSNAWSNWLPDEPDDYCGGEDCAAMTGSGGRWMDASCRLRMPCLCEQGGAPTVEYNRSLPGFRDDTCYADCNDLTKWCSAWPFMRLYGVNDDVCFWEEKDGQKRGRGASQCADRVRAQPDRCGKYFSYSVGRCRCSPPAGEHASCVSREVDATADVFVLDRNGSAGVELAYSRQHCVYGLVVDEEYFSSLKPATAFAERFAIWLRAASIWVSFGAPCALLIAFVVCRSFLCCGLALEAARAALPADLVKPGARAAPARRERANSAYGVLVDTSEDAEAGEAVNRWVYRGAIGAITYGAALLALGATLAAHTAGTTSQGLSLEVFEALVMTVSMAADARAATMVHRRLAPVARQVAGWWVLVLAASKTGVALTAFSGVVVFSTVADRNYENICFAEYMFRWSMLLTLPLQCLAGYALWKVQVRAETYLGSYARMGGWAPVLVAGSFCSGGGVWWGGYLDCVHEASVSAVAACFIVAALGQLAAGVAMLQINRTVKAYFGSAAGQELAASAPGAVQFGRPGVAAQFDGAPPDLSPSALRSAAAA